MNTHKSMQNGVGVDLPATILLAEKVNAFTRYYLGVNGLFYILLGISWLIFDSPSREAGLAWWDFLTTNKVGFVWITAGFISSSSFFVRRDQLMRMGFFSLILVPALFGMYFLISWLLYLLPTDLGDGHPRGLITTISYWGYSASAYVVAKIYSACLTFASEFTSTAKKKKRKR